MRNTLFFVTLLVGLMSVLGCVRDVKKDTTASTAVAANGTADADTKKAWRDKVKAAQAKKANATGAGAGAARNRPQSKAVNSNLKAKYNQPVVTDKNKGVFITEVQQYLTLTPAKTSELEALIKKYKRKGLDFKFFGGFYSDKKPFARDLSKIFTTGQVEKFKHFHSYWFDRIPYPRPDMPVSLYYRLKLDKDQFIKVMDIYSATTVAKNNGNAAATKNGIAKIEALLNAQQKKIYREILSVSPDNF